MADSLILTGVRDVRKHKGSEMLFRYPKNGGSTHQLKRWWANGSSTVYEDCSVFDVTVNNQTVKLAVVSNSGTNLRIDHDGEFNFSFYGMNEVERAALFTVGFELIEHYVFPRISGGKIMTVTPLGGADRPSEEPDEDPTSIGTVTVTGEAAPTDGETETYTVSNDGDAAILIYAWEVDGSGTVSGPANTSTVNIAWSGTDASVVTCIVQSTDAGITDNMQIGTLNVTPTA